MAAAVLVALPVATLLIRAPWSRLGRGAVDSHSAIWLSILVPAVAVALSALAGIPLAWWLARSESRLRPFVRALVLFPIILPPVVGGIALLSAFGRNGVVGSLLGDAFGWVLPFSPAGALLAVTFVTVPFVVLTSEAGFRGTDPQLEEAAASLGASRWMLFRRIALPLARPAILAGLLLGWARGLGEFGATITFAGNSPGRTQTLPLAIFLELERDPGAAFALSLIVMAVSAAVLLVARNRWPVR